MQLAGQTNTNQQATALQGRFAFNVTDSKYTLDIFFFRIEVTVNKELPNLLSIYYVPPAKNGQTEQHKLLWQKYSD